MKCLWVSNSPQAPTGYGQQTALFLPRIRSLGNDVIVFAFTTQGYPTTTPDGFLQLPRVVHPFGNDVVVQHFKSTKRDVAITLVDPFALDPAEYKQIPWCAWCPIDAAPLYNGNKHSLAAARWIWALSHFGKQTLEEAGFKNVRYVPHGVDSKVFTIGDRGAARRALGQAIGHDLTGKFLVVMVAANKSAPSRKGFFEGFSAFKQFADDHKDAFLYVHAEAAHWFGGEDLLAVAELVGLKPEQVAFVPQYPLTTGAIPPSYMASVYNAADVFLSASHGEGFGIPAVEAAMCGCPTILPDNSAQREIADDLLSWKVYDKTPYMTLGHTVWQRPLISTIRDTLSGNWTENDTGRAFERAEIREAALKYDVDTVFKEHMKPALDELRST